MKKLIKEEKKENLITAKLKNNERKKNNKQDLNIITNKIDSKF